jgi:hypothetical protein
MDLTASLLPFLAKKACDAVFAQLLAEKLERRLEKAVSAWASALPTLDQGVASWDHQSGDRRPKMLQAPRLANSTRR